MSLSLPSGQMIKLGKFYRENFRRFPGFPGTFLKTYRFPGSWKFGKKGNPSHYLVFAHKFFCAKKKKNFNSKVASHILCPSFVCKLPHECEDIKKNAWRTPLNAQCNIEYRLQYSLFFSFLNYHRNRIFLYFFGELSMISFLFWVSIPNPVNRVYKMSGIGTGAEWEFWGVILPEPTRT